MPKEVHKIAEGLLGLKQPIDKYEYLKGNPRKGDVDAIAEAYDYFGQVKPIVAVEKDGVFTVISGNHQLKGARKLGWTHIAVVEVPFENDKAIAFALADNRLSEMGTTDTGGVYEMLQTVLPTQVDYFETLGWDDFEIAVMEPEEVAEITTLPPNQGWEPPSLISVEEDEDGDEELKFEGTAEEEKDVITGGATSAGVSGKPNAVQQYTLVFDNNDQIKRWYEFLRFLKGNASMYGAGTTASQLIEFLDTTNFGDE